MRWQGAERSALAGLTWAVIALAGWPALWAQSPVPKTPVPSEAARKEAAAELRKEYGEESAQADSPEKKAALAAKLLTKAEQTTDNLAARFALCEAARELAIQAGQADTALRAIDKMAEQFVLDPLTAKAEALERLAEFSTSPKQLVSLATLADELVEELCAAERFDKAQEILKAAREAAKDSKNGDLVKQLAVHAKQVDAASRAYEQVKPALDVLEEKPTDAKANLAAGRYFCFVKGDWERGVAMLALGGDESLCKVARRDLEGTSDPTRQVALGDAWWKLMESESGAARRQLQLRAGHWYQAALPQLSDTAKEAVAKRLAEIDQTKASASSSKDTARLAKGLAGRYLALAVQRKSKDQKTAAWELFADGTLAEEAQGVGTWTVSESQIVIKFNDATRSAASIRLKKKDPLPGTITFQNGDTWNCELRRGEVIGTWQHRLGNDASAKLRFWSNGYLDYATGLAAWRQEGNRLTLRWPNGDVDVCTVSRDSRSYSGQNQRGGRITGTRIEP